MRTNHVPNFLEAKTKDELRAFMFRNNNRFSKKIHYFDFAQQKNGKWVCWYEISLNEEISKAPNADK